MSFVVKYCPTSLVHGTFAIDLLAQDPRSKMKMFSSYEIFGTNNGSDCPANTSLSVLTCQDSY